MSRLRTIVISAIALALVSLPTAASAADSWTR